MSKVAARAEQFYSRSGSESTKGSRKGFGLLGGGEDVVASLTPEQKRDSLKARLKWLMAVRATSGLSNTEKTELHFLQKDLNRLRPVVRSRAPRDVSKFFMDVCREKLSPFQFRLFLSEASELAIKHEGNQGETA